MGTISEIIPITGFMLHGKHATIPYRWFCVALSFKMLCAYGRSACPTRPSNAPFNPKCELPMNPMSCHPTAPARLVTQRCAL